MEHRPRLKSIAGVARALIASVGPDEAATILVTQFGWDLAFSALSAVETPDACAAMWHVLEQLRCEDPV